MTGAAERIAVVVEDHDDMREVIASILIEAGFEVKLATTGAEGVDLVRAFGPALTTLDVNMASMDGFETLRRIRAFSATRVIMISARFEEIDVVRGLSAGADDFVAKPFRVGELRARIDAVLRRDAAPAVVPADEVSRWLQHDGVRLSPELRLVEVNTIPVALTRSEFDLLARLLKPVGHVNTKAALILELRGDPYATGGLVTGADQRSLEVHVANLRRKIGRNRLGAERIETVRGIGYRASPASALQDGGS